MLAGEFPCPKCRSQSKIRETRLMLDSGVRIRRRKCLNQECGHAWCTAQEPEYLLPKAKWNWDGSVNKPRLLEDVRTEDHLVDEP